MMAELVLTDVNEAVFHQLQQQANSHGRTPEEEAKAIISVALQGNQAWRAVDEIYGRLSASDRSFSDSAELLREDRDR
jgi:antitoxin FitA